MRLIDADIADEKLDEIVKYYIADKSFQCNFAAGVVCDIRDNVIAKMPTIDPASLRSKGEWIFQMSCYEIDECACSACGQLLTTHARERANYCPNCGADMRGSP